MIELTPMEARHIEEVIEDFLIEIETDFNGENTYELESRSREALEIIRSANVNYEFSSVDVEELLDE